MRGGSLKILIAPDSFKGSLAAPEVADAIAAGVNRALPASETVLLPVADGGEGSALALCTATGGRMIEQMVTGARGESVRAAWALMGDNTTAVVELAQAAGLTLLPPARRDPRVTTTYGVGELLQAALAYPGVRRVIIALGGSATNDGGAGILQSFGVRLLDTDGRDLPPGGAALARLAAVDFSQATALRNIPEGIEIRIACDVDNPLTGERGASAVFAPQKGATAADVPLLDAALTHYGVILARYSASGRDVNAVPGAGAAGGAAAGLLYLFPQAVLQPGIDLVLDTIGFDTHLRTADLVLTGEGRLDTQTLGGKAIAGIGRRARARNVPVGAIVGGIGDRVDENLLADQYGVSAVIALPPYPAALETSVARTAEWLADAAARALRWMRIGQERRG